MTATASTPGALPAGGPGWPDGLDPRTICLTVDVEWAEDGVLADLRGLFDERGLKGTFFCTHAGVDVPGHERGLHPNYRRSGDTMTRLLAQSGGSETRLNESDVYRHVLSTTLAFAPEAKGVRSHSLHYDSLLMPAYSEFGLEYDSTYQLPLAPSLRPFWKEYDVLELPIYFSDHFELKTGATGFAAGQLRLDRPGLKVINLHPNMVFLNCSTNEQYNDCKPYYRDRERLLAKRYTGRGIRGLVIDLLDRIANDGLRTATLGEVNSKWRSLEKWS